MSIITKSRTETIKTIVITVLLTGIIAFFAGVTYEQSRSDVQTNAIKSAVEQVKSVK